MERAISLGLVPDDLQSDYTADITRAEFCRLAVAFLAKAAADNGLFLTPQTVSFDDTDDTDVLIAAGFGIVSGDGKGSFRPDDGITRQEAAVMLYNTLWALGMPSIGQGETFTDQASIASWASGAVSAIVDRGVMNGTGGGAFSPLDSYSRQQAYVTMYRLMSSLYLQLETKSYQLLVDETAQAACTLTNGASGASWSSSNPAVVAIASDTGSGTATLRAVGPGTATVTCRSGDYQMTASVTVTQTTTSTGTDFKGKTRIRYSNDVAWDLCRQIENDIGIQIFYLPEFNDSVPGAQVTYDTFSYVSLNNEYFQLVYNELVKMKEAFDLYPDGFLKQVIAKKGSRTTEIVLFPADMTLFSGTPASVVLTGTFANTGGFAGQHVYDESGMRIDRIYYTGTGSPYHYSHEMGHMVVSSAMIANVLLRHGQPAGGLRRDLGLPVALSGQGGRPALLRPVGGPAQQDPLPHRRAHQAVLRCHPGQPALERPGRLVPEGPEPLYSIPLNSPPFRGRIFCVKTGKLWGRRTLHDLYNLMGDNFTIGRYTE